MGECGAHLAMAGKERSKARVGEGSQAFWAGGTGSFELVVEFRRMRGSFTMEVADVSRRKDEGVMSAKCAGELGLACGPACWFWSPSGGTGQWRPGVECFRRRGQSGGGWAANGSGRRRRATRGRRISGWDGDLVRGAGGSEGIGKYRFRGGRGRGRVFVGAVSGAASAEGRLTGPEAGAASEGRGRDSLGVPPTEVPPAAAGMRVGLGRFRVGGGACAVGGPSVGLGGGDRRLAHEEGGGQSVALRGRGSAGVSQAATNTSPASRWHWCIVLSLTAIAAVSGGSGCEGGLANPGAGAGGAWSYGTGPAAGQWPLAVPREPDLGSRGAASAEYVPHVVSGQIVDRVTRRPVANARVALGWKWSLDTEQCIADARGKFRLPVSRVEFDRGFALRLEAPGYSLADRFARARWHAPETCLEIALSPGASAEGQVVGPNGDGLAGAVVFLAPEPQPQVESLPAIRTVADERGFFRFASCVGHGRGYRVAAMAADLVPFSVFFVGPTAGLQVPLKRPGRRVEVCLEDLKTRPVAEARIRILADTLSLRDNEDQGGTPEDTEEEKAIRLAFSMIGFVSDSHGKANVFLPSSHRPSFYARKIDEHDSLISEPCSERWERNRVYMTLVSPMSDCVRLLIADPSGSPLSNRLLVVCTRRENGFDSWTLRTDAAGHLLLCGLGKSQIFVLDRVGIAGPLDLSSSGERTVSVSLRRGAEVRVQLRSRDGRPAAGLPLEIWWRYSVPFYAETDEEGWAVFWNVYPFEEGYSLECDRFVVIPERITLDPQRQDPQLFRAEILSEGPWAFVRGLCVDPDGVPLSEGSVELFVGGRREAAQALTPWNEGRFLLRLPASRVSGELPPPCYVCAVTSPYVSCQEVTRPLVGGPGESMTLRAREAGSLSGRIEHADGRPYRGIVGVVAWDSSGEPGPEGEFWRPSPEMARTDELGRFDLRWVPAGFPVAVAVRRAPGEWGSTKLEAACAVSAKVILGAGEERDMGLLLVRGGQASADEQR